MVCPDSASWHRPELIVHRGDEQIELRLGALEVAVQNLLHLADLVVDGVAVDEHFLRDVMDAAVIFQIREADRYQPVGCIFTADGLKTPGSGLWRGHRAVRADPHRHGGTAPVLLPVPVPDGGGVCPAAGAALRLAAPERYPVHSWVLRLRQALPSGSEAG